MESIIINEAEKWITELEDRMVETTSVEGNEEKRMKGSETVSENSWPPLNTSTYE